MAEAVKPRIKLDKKTATKGDLVEVKALVQHVMETGQRKDNAGNTIPRSTHCLRIAISAAGSLPVGGICMPSIV